MKYMRLLLIQFLLLVLGLVGYCIAAEIGFEAEDADEIVAIMEIYEDKKASGGMYISAGKGGGGRHPGKADFVINVRTPGQYTMWGRVIAQDTAKDSFHVTVDQKKSPQPGDANMIWDTGQHQEWTWAKVKWREKNPLTFDLKPGKHTVHFGLGKAIPVWMPFTWQQTPTLSPNYRVKLRVLLCIPGIA